MDADVTICNPQSQMPPIEFPFVFSGLNSGFSLEKQGRLSRKKFHSELLLQCVIQPFCLNIVRSCTTIEHWSLHDFQSFKVGPKEISDAH